MDVTSYLRRRGLPLEVLSRFPEAAAELPRVVFLQENYFRARSELRGYVAFAAAAPLTAPGFYLLHPSIVMLCCSIAFALVVVSLCAGRIMQRKRTMKDYIQAVERLIQLAKKDALSE